MIITDILDRKEIIKMSNTDNPIRIKPVAYNEYSEPDPSIVMAETFSYKNHFLLLSSKPVPPTGNTYMEFTITGSMNNKYFRYLPLYVGIHKEPSLGNIRTDCILGSIYYKKGQKLHYFEHTKSSPTRTFSVPEKLTARLPIQGTVIGIGVNMIQNTINIYTDGNLLYTISPTKFNMSQNADTDPWYFAIYCSEVELVSGRVNYGRYKLAYKPNDYKSMYDYYYYPSRTTAAKDFTGTLEVVTNNKWTRGDFDGKIDIENTYAPIDMITKKRYLFLQHKTDAMSYYDDHLQFRMYALRGWSAPDITTINLPCPCEQYPVYFELSIKEAEIKKTEQGRLMYHGIPVEVGLTVKKNDYEQKSFRVALYKEVGAHFLSYSVVQDKTDTREESHAFPPVLNPAIPVQPDIIGFLIDRRNNLITLYTAGDKYCEIPIEGVDFSNPEDIVYIFIKSADQVYTGYLRGMVNFGEERIQATLPEGTMTLYDYYIQSIRWYLTRPFPEFECQIRVGFSRNDFSHHILSKVYVPFDKDRDWNTFDRGLNLVNKTFNVITNTETRNNEPIMSQEDFKKYTDDYKK